MSNSSGKSVPQSGARVCVRCQRPGDVRVVTRVKDLSEQKRYRGIAKRIIELSLEL